METTALEEQSALIALLTVRPGKLTWSAITSQVIESGSAVDVWQRHVPQTLPGIEPAGDPLEEARTQILGWQSGEFSLVTVLDQDYPARLRDIHQVPPILFARGTWVENDRAVSIVGSRTATGPGLAFASRAARSLVSAGFTVASGLAAGIDTAAHAAALDATGRTVAVIGTGIRKTYPEQNRELQATIANRGLLLSQFWPDAPPQKQNFLMRNATMSGYGLATVVVEAGETSGARAQARIAVEHGRPVILTQMVVDRNEWPQSLLGRPGVHVADRVEDVVDIVESIAREDAALPTLAASATSG
ncbi:DNA-processing protein DprA [Haloechinothrix salitolerans]|uniref:DNA-processing protein DprA n=1 Tax=Haloechinothrix salitolerans TaxID=926830 RepID=A0ABW2BX07_9PSEU